MSAWSYAGWVTQPDTPSQIAMLRLHIQEVSASIGREVSADGKSVSSNNTLGYIKELNARLDVLMRMPDAGVAGNVSYASFNRPPSPSTTMIGPANS